MKTHRLLKLLLSSWVGLLLFVIMLVWPAAVVRSQEGGETAVERAKALAAEQEARPRRVMPAVTPAELAPLFVGIDNVNIPAYTIDVTNNTFYTAFLGAEIWGATYDPDNERLLYMDGTELWEWPLGGTINLLGNVTVNGAIATMPGLAYDNGTLYGARTLATEGIYTIDVTTLAATIVITYAQAPATVDIGGIAIDAATGLLYGVNDGSVSRGLVQINPDGTLTLVAPYLSGEDDVDGLAIGDGKAYLITDDNTPPYFNVYDLNAMAYTGTISNPWTISEIFAGGAWIDPLPVVYGVDLSPDSQSQTAAAGDTVTYTLAIENRGSVSDTFALGVVSSWATAVSTTTIWLDAGESTTFTAVVDVPGNAVPGDMDTATVTAVSQADPTAADSAALTTFIPLYAVALTPAVDALAGDPGTAVVYTVWVSNTGNMPDTYDLALSGNVWNASLSASTLPLSPGTSANVTVTVEIPAAALAGESDMVTLTALGQTGASDSAGLTTTANAVYGVAATAVTAALSDLPGTAVTFTVQLTNTGNVTDTFALVASSTWTATLSALSQTVGYDASALVQVVVRIPPTAVEGASDVITVTVTSQADGNVTASVLLTATALAPPVTYFYAYLPVVLKP